MTRKGWDPYYLARFSGRNLWFRDFWEGSISLTWKNNDFWRNRISFGLASGPPIVDAYVETYGGIRMGEIQSARVYFLSFAFQPIWKKDRSSEPRLPFSD